MSQRIPAALEGATLHLLAVLQEEIRAELPASDPEQLLTPKQAAARLAISTAQVRYLIKQNMIPHVTMPSSGILEARSTFRIRSSSLDEWIASREQR
jgi:excisionase family DNA binding protein